jgi:UPF0271 protein
MNRPTDQGRSDSNRKPVPAPKINRHVDLNTDFGQSADRSFFEGKERTLLHFVSSVNIPCCVHDSDPHQVLKDIATAKLNNCAVGAHIAYPDPKHYGYQPMDMGMDELEAWIILQLGAFSALCRTNKIDMEHIRPHGALYNAFINNEEVALAVARAVHRFDPWAMLIAPISPLIDQVQSEVELQIVQEIYLGKRVDANGVIILDRASENLHPQGVIEQVKQFLTDGSVTTEDGKVVKVNCKTMHLSPKLQGNMMIAERVNAMLNQPVPLSLVAAGSSGWL